MASYPYPKLMGSPKREVALDPLNELLAYIAPRETVQELIARSVSFNKALFDRIMEIDSFVCNFCCTSNEILANRGGNYRTRLKY